jgi:IS30 family transposase
VGFYRRLSFQEREEISRALAAGAGLRSIAHLLGRSVSSVSRECRRAGRTCWSYRAGEAQREAYGTAHAPRKPRKLEKNPRLRAYVLAKLRQEWSPHQIAKRIREDYPGDVAMRICQETIYQYLYVLPRGELKKELLKALRQKPRYRRKRQVLQETARLRKIPEMISIEERPAEVADRSIPGHWEGDLLVGPGHRSALGTLVERKTRLVLLVPLKQKDMISVREAFARAIRRLPARMTRSLTYDQGFEMRDHQQFTLDTNMTVYFAHPHSPWERGTCENTNGLLRQYFPKGTDFNRVSLYEIRKAEKRLNTRPRNVLNWRTPSEVLCELLR